MISRESIFRNRNGPPSQPVAIERRAMLGDVGGALAAILGSPGAAIAADSDLRNDPFILLLHGIYRPVAMGPSLGLSSVNLSDGTNSRTRIYPVCGIKGDEGSGDA